MDILRRMAVAELVQNWAIWRDAGDWERFATCWHDDGWMMATWCQAPAAQFIEASKAGWAKGVSILHFLGGVSVDLAGARAIAQTKMTISQRAEVEGVLVDVVCTGRFYDFIEERDGRWGVVLRQPIYEKDRMDPVDPSVSLKLDSELLKKFPVGYRHLAYLQTRIGYAVKTDMPGLQGRGWRRFMPRASAGWRGRSWAGWREGWGLISRQGGMRGAPGGVAPVAITGRRAGPRNSRRARSGRRWIA